MEYETAHSIYQKEFLESLRTGRMPLLAILSVLFGIMNPLTAKLLPWMLKTFTGSLEESGMVLTEIKVDVFTSWTQFYKNMPLFRSFLLSSPVGS